MRTSQDKLKDKLLELNADWVSTRSNDIELDLSSSEDTIRRAQQIEDYNGKRQDREQRKKFSFWIFLFVCIYMLIALILLILVGCGCVALNDNVLIALLTTTTANVIGLFTVVAKYLFHPKS